MIGLYLILAGIGMTAVGVFGLTAVLLGQTRADDYLTTALSEGTADEWEDISND